MALDNFEETEKSCKRSPDKGEDHVFAARSKFQGKCFNCEKKGHRGVDCYSKETLRWCVNCKQASHNTKDCRKTHKGDAAKQTADQQEHNFFFTCREKDNDRHGKITPNLLLDSDATSHIIIDQEKFISFDKKFDAKSHLIELADGSKANVVIGKCNAKVKGPLST